jgi:hypothetical protein
MLYAALFLIAVWINSGCKKNLLLTLLVGFSFYFPTELITNYYTWYATCISIEIVKIVSCYMLFSRISPPLLAMNIFMLVCHLMSFIFEINIPYYRQVMPYLEILEILVCILFANKTLYYIKGQIRCLLK